MVLAGVYGPTVVAKQSSPTVEVVCRSSAASGLEHLHENFVQKILESVVSEYPRCTILVVLHTLHHDGANLAALVNAAVAALLNAGIDMKTVPLASAFCVTDPGLVLIDPCAEEEVNGPTLTAVCGPGEDVLGLDATGPMSVQDVTQCCAAAPKVTRTLLEIFRH